MVGAKLGTSQYVYKEAPADVNLKDPLWKMPEMGVFTSFLRRYLHSGEIDLIVHSWKDLPVEKDPATDIVATLPRADPRDLLLVSKAGLDEAYKTGKLVVLSSSPRRKHNLPEFLKKSIPAGPNGERITEVEFRDVRGNIQTRLLKLCGDDLPEDPLTGERFKASALIVAKAAVDRFLLAGRELEEFRQTGDLVRDCLNACMWQVLPLSVNPTAAAQGALAIEMLDGPGTAGSRAEVQSTVNCSATFDSVNKERAILQSLGGGCHQKIGCTILKRQWGQITFLRGQTDKAQTDMNIVSIDRNRESANLRKAQSEANVLLVGGKGLSLFDREPVVGAAAAVKKAFSRAPPSVGMYVAKSDALPAAVRSADIGDRLVWTAGLQSWFSLASRGFWVHGTSDSLGESEPASVFLLTGEEDNKWIKLTHSRGSFELEKGGNQFIDVLSTYALKLKAGIDKSQLKDKTHFFFSSGSAYQGLVSLNPEIRAKLKSGEFVAGCGPGNTLDLLRADLGADKVVVAFNYADFLRQVLAETPNQ